MGGNSKYAQSKRRFGSIRRGNQITKAKLADDEFMQMKHKGWHGLGADAEERAHANTLLGFDSYIVFPTPAFDQIIAMEESITKFTWGH